MKKLSVLNKLSKTYSKSLFPNSNSFFKNFSIKLKDFSELNPKDKHWKLSNFINGEWKGTSKYEEFPDPLKGGRFIEAPLTEKSEMQDIISLMNACPKHGLHNPLKNVDRYLLYGQVCRKVAEALHNEEIFNHFVRVIQRVFPKSDGQTIAELKVTRAFFENFAGDNVRFLARGFNNPGDHEGQQSQGYRWPYGPVCLITPFNFPIEISMLQLMGALFMGNKVLLKVDSKVAGSVQEFLRLLLACGMPQSDVIFVNTNGENMEYLMSQINLRMTLFTGSAKVAERLSKMLHGRIKIEDAGFDWKILGPDVPKEPSEIDHVASISDQDAYALSGQKCSAQSVMFVHKNWMEAKFIEKIKALAEKRNLKDLTISPVMTWSNKRLQEHVDNVLKIPGAQLLFGGSPITEHHSIPEVYGSFKPTAIFVPIKAFSTKKHYDLITTEVFGPFQIVTEYNDNNLDVVLNILESFEAHLTAGVASNDVKFLNKVLSNSVNGVTYAGIRARTTGAPQNHWFGPCGDPRAGGIGTPEAIKYVWSSHREVIMDTQFPNNFKIIQN
jgi:1-pyrroline-5-carboxylate dehydrogenase